MSILGIFLAAKQTSTSLSYNEDLLVKKCSPETFFIHTPAWNTCPHSNFLTSSMLKPSWQMTQISSSSFGGCDSGFKHTQHNYSTIIVQQILVITLTVFYIIHVIYWKLKTQNHIHVSSRNLYKIFLLLHIPGNAKPLFNASLYIMHRYH